MGKEELLNQLVDARQEVGVYAECDDCLGQTFVDELWVEETQAYGICNECLNTVMVSLEDLQHEGKGF